MKNLLSLARRSIVFYKRDYLYQLIIIGLLGAIITGSLFTGDSVRKSLRKSTFEKLGNAGILVSSGLRFFDPALSERLSRYYDLSGIPFLETEGYCQNFATGATSLNVNIYGIQDGFFEFHGVSGIGIQKGTVAINSRMADHLNIKEGDEIIIRFREADPLPANAPFAPAEGSQGSRVLKVARILNADQAGNFSLGISQVIPQNVFMNLADLKKNNTEQTRVNRLIIGSDENISTDSLFRIFKRILQPSDIGLSFRKSDSNQVNEIISDRIFIDSSLVETICSRIPKSEPVITYLANKISSGKSETPYSFISGIKTGNSLTLNDNQLILNKWIADDLGVTAGDSLLLSWYVLSGKQLTEIEKEFIVSDIVSIEGIFADQNLMPEFPGISGRTSCSSWDAGIPILMDRIRDKDEDYWNVHKGTPKLFVSYETGKKLWGNIFGTATAIRFPPETDSVSVQAALKGSLDPSFTGFTFTDMRKSGEDAASLSVDFSSLFLGLGFFILVSCIILLSYSISTFFDSKKGQIVTYHSLGFTNKLIARILFSEMFPVQVAASILGALAGTVVNLLIVKALNSVWIGAVQTDTITAGFSLVSLLAGFFVTMVTAFLVAVIKLRSFLAKVSVSARVGTDFPSVRLNLVLILVFLPAAIITTIITVLGNDPGVLLSFISGTLVFISLILIIRQYYILDRWKRKGLNSTSGRFYAAFPGQITMPVLFIAAGIFAVIITGANRLSVTDEMLENKGGTGGYKLWAETAIPVKADINSPGGRLKSGLDGPLFENVEILQASRLNGNDASCLNLNHITMPPVLGIDSRKLAERKSFSFATILSNEVTTSPWELLYSEPDEKTIYGIADQTVLKWGLKLNTGDTLILRSESGLPLNIVICGGLSSSVFQGNLIISEESFRKFFPSVAGISVFLVDCDTSKMKEVSEVMSDRFSANGMSVEPAPEKLASFFVVTNTYLNVFMILGILGLMLGVVGLGFVLLRNFEQRKKEFALLIATGYTYKQLKIYLLADQVIVLVFGIFTGVVSALIATLPSLKNGNGISWSLLIVMISLLFTTGFSVLIISMRRVWKENLVLQLRRD